MSILMKVILFFCVASISEGHGYFGARQLPPVKMQHYRIPVPRVEILKTKGFKVSIPDELGVEIFTFHGSINVELSSQNTGAISGEIGRPKNGRWMYHNTDIKIKPGDTIYYWLFVQKNGVGYRKDGLRYVVPGKLI